MFRDAMANKRDAVKEADELVTQVFITCKCLNGHFSEHEWRAANESAIREFLPVAHESFHQGTARGRISITQLQRQFEQGLVDRKHAFESFIKGQATKFTRLKVYIVPFSFST